jgi:hypothetical protein
MRRRLAILTLLLVGSMGPGSDLHAQAADLTGCYTFDRPLGSSATGDVERGDSSWYRLKLEPAGKVARPGLVRTSWRDQYAHFSTWHSSGDTLFIRVSTGLVGWDLTLLPDANRYVGRGRYLSDAFVVGAEPLHVRVQATREVCRPSPPA